MPLSSSLRDLQWITFPWVSCYSDGLGKISLLSFGGLQISDKMKEEQENPHVMSNRKQFM